MGGLRAEEFENELKRNELVKSRNLCVCCEVSLNENSTLCIILSDISANWFFAHTRYAQYLT